MRPTQASATVSTRAHGNSPAWPSLNILGSTRVDLWVARTKRSATGITHRHLPGTDDHNVGLTKATNILGQLAKVVSICKLDIDHVARKLTLILPDLEQLIDLLSAFVIATLLGHLVQESMSICNRIWETEPQKSAAFTPYAYSLLPPGKRRLAINSVDDTDTTTVNLFCSHTRLQF